MEGFITAAFVAVPTVLLIILLLVLGRRERRSIREVPDESAWPNRSPTLRRVIAQYRLGDASFEEMVPRLTRELVIHQRGGRPVAAAILSEYAEELYLAARARGAGPNEREMYALLAPDGRITSKSNAKQPAVPLFTGFEPVRVFYWSSWEDSGGLHHHIHLAAAAFALAELRSAKEAGSKALPELLERAWFLLAFALNTHLHNAKMLSSDRRLILGLIDCCARLHELSAKSEVPSFVHDAIEHKITFRRYRQEWVTDHQETHSDGRTYNIGDFVTLKTNDRLRVWKLLQERFDTPAP